MDIDQYILQKKREIIYNCKKCNGHDPFCDCVKRFNLEIKKVESNIPEILYNVEFKTLGVGEDIKQKINKFVADKSQRILYIEGSGAIERNSVVSIVLRSFIKNGLITDYITPFRLSNIASGWRKELFTEYDILSQKDIVAFTDIGDERRFDSLATEKLVNSILRERIYSNKKTIISSSLRIEDFNKEYIKDSSIYGQGTILVVLPTKKSIKDVFKDLRGEK